MYTEYRSPSLPITTRAAEGLMRRRFSVAEIDAMVRAGILYEDGSFELIGGEAVPKLPRGIAHEVLRTELGMEWGSRMPRNIVLAPVTTFRVSEDTFFEPDFVFFRKEVGFEGLKPETCLLVVEVAEESLDYDLIRKAVLYATFGIRELWVIDAVKLETHVHRGPGLMGYEDIRAVPPDGVLKLDFAPKVSVSLGALEL